MIYRLRVLDNEEAAKNRKDEARNTLESYLYRMRDLLDDENPDTPFKKCSQESERQTITEKLEDSFAWLHDRADVAETSQFLDKRISLEWVKFQPMPRQLTDSVPKGSGKTHHPPLPGNRSVPPSAQ